MILRPTTFLIAITTAIVTSLFWVAQASSAGAAVPATPVQGPALALAMAPTTPHGAPSANEACLSCHSSETLAKQLPNGDVLPLTIPPATFETSAHGEANVGCADCHTDISPTTLQHPALLAQTRRDVTTIYYTSCKQCHEKQYDLTLDSTHVHARAAGDDNAAVCSDCHDPHNQPRLTDKTPTAEDPDARTLRVDMRVTVAQTCAHCHNTIYTDYAKGVHGANLLKDNNPDVPICIDCHGVHEITDPTKAQFLLKSPDLCAGCHTDPKRMDKYEISTNVFDTYVADFHGTTVTLFKEGNQGADAATNKPVCYDCHGTHYIPAVDDPQHGLQVKANLLKACQKCHPNATDNYPSAWLSHYTPSPDKAPLVFAVQTFYNILIPLVIGGMVIFVITDALRRMINATKGTKHA